MKKIFALLISCAAILFSCNMNMTSGDTDLIVHLPGSEDRAVQRYGESDVVSYRIDLTNDDGDYYSETGAAGGIIVFKNILSGTYKVNIWGLDGNTFVAAKTSTTVSIFKGEENYLSADALLQNKVEDFFVSVSKGVWNSKYREYYRDEDYYNAVRDVDYGSIQEQGTSDAVTWAEIINSELDYAYLNFSYDSVDYSQIPSGKTFSFTFELKTENASEIAVSVLDPLKEKYGPTSYFRYNPTSDNSFSSFTITLPYRPYLWKPVVRIKFPKDCGKIYIRSPGLTFFTNTPSTNVPIIQNTAQLPFEQNLVQVVTENVTKKYVFDKGRIGSNYASILFTGMQIKKMSDTIWYSVSLKGLQVNKPVDSLYVAVKSFASNENLYEAQLNNYPLSVVDESGNHCRYYFDFIVPPILVSNADYEGAYLEIHPEGWEGDVLEMQIEDITYTNSTITRGLQESADSFLMEYHYLKEHEYNSLVKLDHTSGYDATLSPGESKTFVVSSYTNLDSHCNPVLGMKAMAGELFSNTELDQGGSIPFNTKLFDCNVSELVCSKTSDGKIYIKNTTPYELMLNLKLITMLPEPKLQITKKTLTNHIYKFDYKTSDEIIIDGDYKKVKVATIDTEPYIDSHNRLKISNLTFKPVIGTSPDISGMDLNQEEKKPFVQFVLKTKSGIVKASDVVPVGALTQEDSSYNIIKFQDSEVRELNPNSADSVLEIYLGYKKTLPANRFSVYDFSVKLEGEDL